MKGIKNKDLDLTNKLHLKSIISEVESASNRARKKEAYKAFECSEGNQIEYVEKELRTLYPKTHNKFRVGDISISKKITNKKNKAYKTAPTRALLKETETKELTNIFDKYKFDRAFKEADKIFNLHKYVALWLHYINPEEVSTELKGKYKLTALAPYEYDIMRDEETGEPLIFILSYPDVEITGGQDGIEQSIAESQRDISAEHKKYRVWSKDIYVEAFTSSTTKNTVLAQIDIKPNVIKRLPVSFLSFDTAVDYPLPSNLTDQSIRWNVEFSDLKTAAATQGHGQLVIKHPENMKFQNLHMGMHTAITLPQSKKENDKPTEADYISASPDLAGQLEVLKFNLVSILDDHSVNTKSAIIGGTDNVKSGFDRLIKEADVQDVIEENQSLYANNLEQDNYLVLKSYEEALNLNTFTAPSLSVFFEKPKVLISDKETLDNIKQREELGTLLPYEKHIILNPNLSVAQAKAREQEIQDYKAEQAAKVQELLGSPLDTQGSALQNE